jgi:hypothetical protein
MMTTRVKPSQADPQGLKRAEAPVHVGSDIEVKTEEKALMVSASMTVA